jgi:hypothetical protein
MNSTSRLVFLALASLLLLVPDYIDLDSGRFHGGKLWKVTPLLYWHLSDNLRSAFVYGYSELDRFDLKGGTHFYQLRLQVLI